MSTIQETEAEARIRQGKAIYAEKIAQAITEADHGKFVAIDAATGLYVLDEDDLSAIQNLQALAPHPELVLLRVGHATPYRWRGLR